MVYNVSKYGVICVIWFCLANKAAKVHVVQCKYVVMQLVEHGTSNDKVYTLFEKHLLG